MALVSASCLASMVAFDLELLAATGRPRPRVAILPTASFPDGEDVFSHWASLGVAHFGELGAEVEPVLVRDRADADEPPHVQAVGEADLDLPLGRRARPPVDVLDGSGVGWALSAAHVAGRDRAGCSAGAMALAGALRPAPRVLLWPAPLARRARVVAGASVVPALRRLAGAAVGAARAAGAARLGGARDRRGDGARRPRRLVAGPRPGPGHRLARTATASDTERGTSSGSRRRTLGTPR